jgi:acyl-CoA synthetase (AMP-forming)/AMP-acid ligase II
MSFEALQSTVNGVLISCDRFSGQLAVQDDGCSWTFEDLRAHVLDAVAGFMTWGVQPGDRVGLCASNSARWIVTALGIQGAGGILVPLNTRFMGHELSHILDKSGARRVVSEDAGVRLGRVREAGGDVSEQTWLALDDEDDWAAFIAAGAGVSEADVLARIAAIRPDDVSDILFTSGTTGFPKGVVFTHGQSLRAYGELGVGFGYGSTDRFLLIPPFFHALGYKSGWFAGFLHGSAALPERRFDAQQMMERIERDAATMMIGPPTIFAELLSQARSGERDFSSLRLIVPASTNVPPELVRRMGDELGLTVLTGYGITEASAIVTYTRAGEDLELVADSTGRPAPGVDVLIVDDDDRPLPPGHEGNVLVGGYTVMTGYWNDPAATELAITADGRLRTGDIGSVDEHGYVRITGRKKDMIIVGGFNVYPAEVERLLSAHPIIAEVAVVNVPDERLGEVPFAFVVPASGGTLGRDELIAWARTRMANFKVPRYVELVDALPKNSSMKVLRDGLRARATASVAVDAQT